MNFELLKKPKLFEPGDENIWTDPYISQRMLEAHLSTDHDATLKNCTRRKEKLSQWKTIKEYHVVI